jgi:hypothetical protein
MSWDVLVVSPLADIKSADERTTETDLPPLGSASDVRRQLVEALPHMDLSDPARGDLIGPSWTIDVGLGSGDPIHSIFLSVRGAGDDVLPVIATIASAVGGRVFDPVTGEYLTGCPEDATGWHAFQAFRDRLFDQGRMRAEE